VLEKLRTIAKRLDSLQAVRNARVRGRFRFLLPFFNLLLKIKTRNPVGFNEKVEYKMARDRRPLLTVFADKLEAKKYVEQVLGPGYVPEVLAVADRASDLPWDELPREYLAKVNHGCGGGVIVSDDAYPDQEVPEATIANAWKLPRVIAPRNAAAKAIAGLLDLHLALDYGCVSGEWAYHGIDRRAFAERLTRGPADGDPVEYRLYVFSGSCQMIIVGTALIHPNPPMDVFLPDWTRLDATRPGTRHHELAPERPAFLSEMVEAAEALGRDTDFLRVDVLASDSRFLVGELTNYPYAGRVPIEPVQVDLWLGGLWAQPADYGTLPTRNYPLPAPEAHQLALSS